MKTMLIVFSLSIAMILILPYKSVFEVSGFSVIWNVDEAAGEIYKVNPIGEGNNWLYQLQGPKMEEILASDYKHVIIDYSRDGSDERAHTRAQIDSLKRAGIKTISYLSIGEAEDYRFYWDDSFVGQSWLGIENKNWPGNFKVRYWEAGWQKHIYAYLDKILANGYDGIYMDIIDGYYYWGNTDEFGEGALPGDPVDEADAAKRMIQFVADLSKYAKKSNPDFIIISQNAVRIVDYDEDDLFMDSIDGLGIESLWYRETKKKADKDVALRLNYIRKYFKAGKFVVVVDYVDDGSNSDENKARIKNFINNCKKEGYNYFVGNEDRALDVLK